MLEMWRGQIIGGWPGAALEPAAALLWCATVAEVRTRDVRSTVPSAAVAPLGFVNRQPVLPEKINMLCERCHEREATVHFTKIAGEHMTKQNWCKVCFVELMPDEAKSMFERSGYGPTSTDAPDKPNTE